MSAIASIKTAGAVDAASLAAGDSIGSVVATGSATVGVSRTFDPEGFILPGVTRWVDRSGGIAIGYPAISLSVRPPSKASRVYKVMCKVVLPTLEQTSASTASGIQPAPTKAYDSTAVIEFMLPERSQSWERYALLDLVKSLMFGTITASDADPSDSTGSPLIDAVRNFDRPY